MSSAAHGNWSQFPLLSIVAGCSSASKGRSSPCSLRCAWLRSRSAPLTRSARPAVLDARSAPRNGPFSLTKEWLIEQRPSQRESAVTSFYAQNAVTRLDQRPESVRSPVTTRRDDATPAAIASEWGPASDRNRWPPSDRITRPTSSESASGPAARAGRAAARSRRYGRTCRKNPRSWCADPRRPAGWRTAAIQCSPIRRLTEAGRSNQPMGRLGAR